MLHNLYFTIIILFSKKEKKHIGIFLCKQFLTQLIKTLIGCCFNYELSDILNKIPINCYLSHAFLMDICKYFGLCTLGKIEVLFLLPSLSSYMTN